MNLSGHGVIKIRFLPANVRRFNFEKGRLSMTFCEKVYYICKLIPEGKVVTYGQIAIIIGKPRAPRQVGGALHRSPKGMYLPAHRVINRDGVLTGAAAFTFEKEQESRLRAEGVEVLHSKVDLKKYRWNPSRKELEKIAEMIK